MKSAMRALWTKQDQHEGDRWRLFRAVRETIDAERVLYPGSYVDIAPSFVFQNVTYLDIDKRTPAFFADRAGILEIIAEHDGPLAQPTAKTVFVLAEQSGVYRKQVSGVVALTTVSSLFVLPIWIFICDQIWPSAFT
jgi:hypothetical protein